MRARALITKVDKLQEPPQRIGDSVLTLKRSRKKVTSQTKHVLTTPLSRYLSVLFAQQSGKEFNIMVAVLFVRLLHDATEQ